MVPSNVIVYNGTFRTRAMLFIKSEIWTKGYLSFGIINCSDRRHIYSAKYDIFKETSYYIYKNRNVKRPKFNTYAEAIHKYPECSFRLHHLNSALKSLTTRFDTRNVPPKSTEL